MFEKHSPIKEVGSRRGLQNLALALLLVRLLDFQATAHWFPDLFAQLVFQYFLLGLILALGLLCVKSPRYALLALLIAVFSLGQMWFTTKFTLADHKTKPDLTIVQYNTRFENGRDEDIKSWLLENRQRFDVVIMQETSPKIGYMADTMLKDYPYQIHENRIDQFATVVMSKYPFIEKERYNLPNMIYSGYLTRFIIQPPSMKKPVEIFALHAVPPIGEDFETIRNSELEVTSSRVAQSKTPHIILEGDWNVTPYSPFYHRVATATNLREQRTDILPLPTWPTSGVPWLFQLPIDHILTDRGMTMLDETRDDPIGSDHYPLIASFHETAD